jgi:Flp pilus assembly protein TadB
VLGAEWAHIGPWGVVTIFVLMIGLGLLIPRWVHTQRVNDLKEQLAEWKSIAHKAMGTGETAVAVLEEIKEEAANK